MGYVIVPVAGIGVLLMLAVLFFGRDRIVAFPYALGPDFVYGTHPVPFARPIPPEPRLVGPGQPPAATATAEVP